jgi:hypothetical protein
MLVFGGCDGLNKADWCGKVDRLIGGYWMKVMDG